MRALRLILAAAVVVLAVAAGIAPVAGATDGKPGGGHDPVTVCHKPGTPAEKTLTFDDDALWAHLGHGDTLGPCAPPPPAAVCPEGTTPVAQSNPLVCIKTVEKVVEVVKEVPGPTVTVTKEVPGPTVYVDRPVPGPTVTVEKPVPGPTVTKVVTKVVKVKGKTKVVYRTKVVVKVKVKKVPSYGICKLPNGKLAVPGAG